MQEIINKVKTYIGFSIKSNSIVFGSDNILKLKKKPDVVIICNSATEKVINQIKKTGFKCVMLKNILLSEILQRDNVKVIAIKNDNLAKAILSYDLFETLN